jgi:hypothetical protein
LFNQDAKRQRAEQTIQRRSEMLVVKKLLKI